MTKGKYQFDGSFSNFKKQNIVESSINHRNM